MVNLTANDAPIRNCALRTKNKTNLKGLSKELKTVPFIKREVPLGLQFLSAPSFFCCC